MINSIILCTVNGVFILISFTIGLSFGVKLRNNEKIAVENPVKKIKEKKIAKKQEEKIAKEAEIEEINLANIDAYDGTPYGQKEFPE